jgi:putative aldouronate transport system substrate-binding protein
MKKSKILAICLSLFMLAGLFSGFMRSAAVKEAPGEINILYPGDLSDRMSDFLSNDFAKVMEKDLNLKVKMTFLPWDQYWTQKSIMLAAKQPIDLYWDGLPDLSTMVNKKECRPLDDLIKKFGQNIIKAFPKGYLKGGQVNGVTYGIPATNCPSSGMYQMVCVRQDILEAVGMKEIKTPDDLQHFAEKAKAKFPQMKGGADPIFKPLTRYFSNEQYNWIAAPELVVFGEVTHKAYSYFETKAYQDLAKFNRKLSNEGLYSDDVTIKYNERDTRMQSGQYLWVEGSLGKENEIIAAVKKNAPTASLKSYLLAPEKPRYVTAAGGEALCIPYSAPNPEGAMKFLNWLYASKDNYNLALYGVKGVDYNIENGRIKRIATSDFFYEWMFRNKNLQMFTPDVDQNFINTYNHWDDKAIVSKSFGFRFDNSKVKNIELKLNEVTGKQFAAIRT